MKASNRKWGLFLLVPCLWFAGNWLLAGQPSASLDNKARQMVVLDVDNRRAVYHDGRLFYQMDEIGVRPEQAEEFIQGTIEQKKTSDNRYPDLEGMQFNRGQGGDSYFEVKNYEDLIALRTIWDNEKTLLAADPAAWYALYDVETMDFPRMEFALYPKIQKGDFSLNVTLDDKITSTLKRSSQKWPAKLPLENSVVKIRTNTFIFSYVAVLDQSEKQIRFYDRIHKKIWTMDCPSLF